MHTAVIKLTEAQATVIDQVVSNSPWYYKQAKNCRFDFLVEDESELEFQFVLRDPKSRATIPAAKAWIREYEDSDENHLIEITYAAQKLGWPLRTCEAIRNKIKRASIRMARYHQKKGTAA